MARPDARANGRTVENGLLRYEGRQERDALFVLLTAPALLSAAALAAQPPASVWGAAPAILLLVLGVLVLHLCRRSSPLTVLIDCERGTVSIAGAGAFRRSRAARRLPGPVRVMVRERRTPVDAGYHLSTYSVALSGGGRRIVLLTTGAEQEALAVRNEIAACLQPAIDGRPEDDA